MEKPNLTKDKPIVNSDSGLWGIKLNRIIDTLQTFCNNVVDTISTLLQKGNVSEDYNSGEKIEIKIKENKQKIEETQTNLNNKLDKGTYAGTAQDLKNEIDTKLSSSSLNVSEFAKKNESNIFTENNTFNKGVVTNSIQFTDSKDIIKQGDTPNEIVIGNSEKDLKLVGNGEKLLYNGKEIGGNSNLPLLVPKTYEEVKSYINDVENTYIIDLYEGKFLDATEYNEMVIQGDGRRYYEVNTKQALYSNTYVEEFDWSSILDPYLVSRIKRACPLLTMESNRVGVCKAKGVKGFYNFSWDNFDCKITVKDFYNIQENIPNTENLYIVSCIVGLKYKYNNGNSEYDILPLIHGRVGYISNTYIVDYFNSLNIQDKIVYEYSILNSSITPLTKGKYSSNTIIVFKLNDKVYIGNSPTNKIIHTEYKNIYENLNLLNTGQISYPQLTTRELLVTNPPIYNYSRDKYSTRYILKDGTIQNNIEGYTEYIESKEPHVYPELTTRSHSTEDSYIDTPISYVPNETFSPCMYIARYNKTPITNLVNTDNWKYYLVDKQQIKYLKDNYIGLYEIFYGIYAKSIFVTNYLELKKLRDPIPLPIMTRNSLVLCYIKGDMDTTTVEDIFAYHKFTTEQMQEIFSKYHTVNNNVMKAFNPNFVYSSIYLYAFLIYTPDIDNPPQYCIPLDVCTTGGLNPGYVKIKDKVTKQGIIHQYDRINTVDERDTYIPFYNSTTKKLKVFDVIEKKYVELTLQ